MQRQPFQFVTEQRSTLRHKFVNVICVAAVRCVEHVCLAVQKYRVADEIKGVLPIAQIIEDGRFSVAFNVRAQRITWYVRCVRDVNADSSR